MTQPPVSLRERLLAAADAPYDMRDLHGRSELLREAAAALPDPMNADGKQRALPELPEPVRRGDAYAFGRDFYTAEQMRAYALAALEKDDGK